MTRNDYIDDVEMRLYGGNPSDDSVTRSQIGMVIDSVAQPVMSEWIRKVAGGVVPSSITQPYDATVLKKDNCGKPQYYVELPKDSEGYTLPLLALPVDEGLLEVEIGIQRVLAATNHSLLKNSLELQFGRKTPYSLWTGNEVYLYNGVFIEGSTIKLWGVFIDTSPESTKAYPVVEDVRAQVLNNATEILWNEIYKTKQDLTDDGI